MLVSKTARRLATVAGLCAILPACSSTTQAPDNTLTILGSATAAPSINPAISGLLQDPAPETGTPSSMTVGMYALYISPNDDCSDAVLVADYGSTPSPKDFVQNPVLFTGAPDAGTYHCVAFKMSDVITMTPATSFGPCVAGTVYPNDIYRDGEDDWKDIDMNPIVAHGTDEAPVDDHVTLFLTRDPSAVIARGASEHQTIELLSDLVVPAQSTFFWNAEGSISTEGGFCSLQPGRPEFQ